MIDITNKPKHKILAALHNAARSQGFGLFNPNGAHDMSDADAQQIIEQRRGNLCFDYLNGRVLKVDLSGTEFDPCLYDRDNGQGAAARAIASLIP
jgi:hypothetical protein